MFTLMISRMGFRLLAGAIAAAFLTLAPFGGGAIRSAQAQVSISAEFRTALEPHGRWQRHSRWGDVWIPANRSRDWRPYTNGRWVWTADWGWYWVEDDAEAAWGWVAYHYGRWVYDEELEWCWIPGEDWGPAWVQWRRGGDVVGWAALPPDDVIVEYNERPDVWIFVRSRDFVAPRIATVIIPQREHSVYFRDTVIENRTVVFRDRRYAVNPGIPAAFIAASVGRPLRAYDVRPRVFAGTARIPGALEVRAQDLRRRDAVRSFRTEVRQSRTEIRPTGRVPDPQPLRAGEQGRLGDNPPRAARQEGLGPRGTEGRGPQQKQLPPTEGRQQPKQPPQTQGRGEVQRTEPPQTDRRGRGERKQPPATEGRAPGEQKQLPRAEERRRGEPKQPPRGEERRGGEPKQLPGTEGRGRGEPKQPPRNEERRGGERRGIDQRQPPQTQGRGIEQRQPPQTQGRGGIEQRQPPQTQGRGGMEQRQPPQTQGRGGMEQRQPPQTQGRGGGEQRQAPAPQGRGGGGMQREQR